MTSPDSLLQALQRRPLCCCPLDSPLGAMTLAASDTGLAGVWFDGQKHMPDTRGWTVRPDHPLLAQAAHELRQYFGGRRLQFSVPLDLQAGTPFQQQVWAGLLAIAPGCSQSYGALAVHMGRPSAARAVGAAVGHNPVSILVPCHRVLGANGSLTGYAGGLARKTALLQVEQQALTSSHAL